MILHKICWCQHFSGLPKWHDLRQSCVKNSKIFQCNSNSDDITEKSIKVIAVQFWFSDLWKYILFDWVVKVQVLFRSEIKMARKRISWFEAIEFNIFIQMKKIIILIVAMKVIAIVKMQMPLYLGHQMITWQIVKVMNWVLIMWQVILKLNMAILWERKYSFIIDALCMLFQVSKPHLIWKITNLLTILMLPLKI